ncbi:hypothetical protein [Cupriavidus basilensis]
MRQMPPESLITGNAIGLLPRELFPTFVERTFRGASVRSAEDMAALREYVATQAVGLTVGVETILPAFGDLCPNAESVVLDHMHTRLMSSFMGAAAAHLFKQHVLQGNASMTVGLKMKHMNTVRRNSLLGVCPDCYAEQRKEGVRLPIWLAAPAVRGYGWCPRHGSEILRKCAVCQTPYSYKESGCMPTLRCPHCGGRMVGEGGVASQAFGIEVAGDFDLILEGGLDGFTGEEIQEVLSQASQRHGVVGNRASETMNELLHDCGGSDFLAPYFNRLNYKDVLLRLATTGHHLCTSPLVNVVACRIMVGSIEGLRKALVAKRIVAQVTGNTAATSVMGFTEGQLSAARALIDETLRANPDIPGQFLSTKFIEPLNGVVATNPDWFQARVAQHREQKLAHRRELVDAHYAEQIEERAHRYQNDAMAPWMNVRELTRDIVSYGHVRRMPRASAVVDRYLETHREWLYRQFRCLARDFPVCLDEQAKSILTIGFDKVTRTTFNECLARLKTCVSEFAEEKHGAY